MKFKPLGKRVLVKIDPRKEKTETGLYIPENATNEFATGEVVGKGEEATNVNVGDKIMFATTVGVDIEVDGEKYRLIPDEGYIDAVI